MNRLGSTMLLAVLASVALADTPAQKTFDALKKLEGTWVEKKGKDSLTVVYKLTGAGSTLIETQMPGTPMEMVSVYHLDGPDTLLLTHYCAARNQPTMKLVPGATAKEFKFDFVSGTNMKPTDMHIHKVRYQLLSPDHITSEWEGYVKGKPGGTEKFDLRRVREK